MARPRRFSEVDVVDRALATFAELGYAGSSMTVLSNAMGISAPSIYAAFGSKRGLFERALSRYEEQMSVYRAWVLSATTSRAVVARMLLGAIGEQPGPALPPAGLLLQPPSTISPDEDIRRELEERRAVNTRALAARFEQAEAAGEATPGGGAEQLAEFLMTVVDGLMVRQHAGTSREELAGLARSAVASISIEAAKNEASPRGSGSGRGRPRQFHVSDVVDRAMLVFWTKGYDGTSLSDLTAAMKINRPSLYAQFGNKEHLFLRALERYEAVNLGYAREALEIKQIRGVVDRLLDGAITAQLNDATPRGCLWTTNAQQGGDHADNIRIQVRARMAAAQERLLARVRQAQEEGDLPSSIDPRGFTLLIGSVLQSITTLGSAGATEAELRALVESIDALMTPAHATLQDAAHAGASRDA